MKWYTLVNFELVIQNKCLTLTCNFNNFKRSYLLNILANEITTMNSLYNSTKSCMVFTMKGPYLIETTIEDSVKHHVAITLFLVRYSRFFTYLGKRGFLIIMKHRSNLRKFLYIYLAH